MLVDRKIEIELTESEMVQIANEAAKLQSDYFAKEIEFADYKKNEKRKIDDLKSMVVELLRNIKKGTKEITIECEEKFDFENRIIHYWHCNKEVDQRSMTHDEFDFLVQKHCSMKVDELNGKRDYYQDDKIVYSRPMSIQELENHKQLLLMPEMK